MPGDIGDCLLQDTVERGLHRGVQPPVVECQAQNEPQVQPLAPCLDEMTNGGLKAEVIQCGRADFPGQAVHLGADAVGETFKSRKPLLLCRCRQGVAEFIQTKLKKGERLSKAIVQFPRDSLALGLLVLHR